MIQDNFLQNTHLFEWPFKHAIINEFFTSSDYEQLLRRLPDNSQYTRDSFNAAQHRYEFWLNEQNLKRLNPEDYRFWNAVHKNIIDKGSSLLNVCTRHLDVSAKNPSFLPQQYQIWVRLVREHCPFVLSPHLDMHVKSYVIVVYLASDGQFKQCGTTLYKRIGSHFLPLKKLPYIPNLATILPRTKNAWHGGRWNESLVRNTLHIYFTHYSELELINDDAAGKQYQFEY